jgi:hypothetical protein
MRHRMIIAVLAALALLAAPATAEDRTIPKGAEPLPGGGYAVPLVAETPDWYTADLHARVVAAGERGESVPIPEDVKVPQSALLFTGIRPGSWMLAPSWCTMNFVFGDGSLAAAPASSSASDDSFAPKMKRPKPTKTSGGGGLYIGSAGHCGAVGDEVVIVGAPGVLMNVGSIVKSVDNGIGDDFSLTKIDPAWYSSVNPSMAYFGGPTGTRSPAFGDPILHVGHGLGVGTGGTPRAGVVTYGAGSGDAGEAYGWSGAANLGDSGSGVRHAAGPAVGNLTHLVVGTKYAPAYIAGTTINRMLQIAGQPLVTASLIPDPLP